MKNLIRLLCVFALASLLLAPALADDAKKFEGGFVWTRSDGDRTGDLEAVFTPQGKGEWAVAFHFDWEDGPHVYKGTAKGNLKKGKLSGEVETDNEERKGTFRFSASIKDGKIEGTHASVNKEGELRDTGTFMLEASK